jgi:hypothetical protein
MAELTRRGVAQTAADAKRLQENSLMWVLVVLVALGIARLYHWL